MAVSKAQQKAVTKYDAKAYDKTLLRLPRGKLDVVKAHATAHSESVNGFIGRAISETMERDGGGPQEAAGEGLPQFLDRAVTTQAKRDEVERKLKGGEQGGH